MCGQGYTWDVARVNYFLRWVTARKTVASNHLISGYIIYIYIYTSKLDNSTSSTRGYLGLSGYPYANPWDSGYRDAHDALRYGTLVRQMVRMRGCMFGWSQQLVIDGLSCDGYDGLPWLPKVLVGLLL